LKRERSLVVRGRANIVNCVGTGTPDAAVPVYV
jgi:hypothetical protein